MVANTKKATVGIPSSLVPSSSLVLFSTSNQPSTRETTPTSIDTKESERDKSALQRNNILLSSEYQTSSEMSLTGFEKFLKGVMELDGVVFNKSCMERGSA